MLLFFIGLVSWNIGFVLVATSNFSFNETIIISEIVSTAGYPHIEGINCNYCNFTIDPSYSEKFQMDLIALHDDSDSVEAVHFLFNGLDLSTYKEEKIRSGIHVFNPNWWIWAKNKNHFVFTLPLIDVDILSLG